MKKIAKLGTLVATVWIIFALTSKSADAHHPEVLVSSVCIPPDESFIGIMATAWKFWDDGTPVTPDRRFNSDVRVYIGNSSIMADSWLLVGRGHFGPDNNYSFVTNNIQKNAVGSVTVRVVSVAPWGPNGEFNSLGDTREAVIDLSNDCANEATTTTTTTPPIPEETTTTPSSSKKIDRDVPPAPPIVKEPHFPG